MDINSIISMIEKNKHSSAFTGELNGLDRFKNQILDDIIEQLRKMSDWMPIETAPTDGTYVDLLINGERAVSCKFLDGEWVDWDCREGKFCWSGEPTHWVSIPKPPNSKEL